MDSILTSIKKYLGIESNYIHFDNDIIMCINNAFFSLNQLGVGPDEPFSITSSSEEWNEFISDGSIESVKTYVMLKVKEIFDPPSNGSLSNAIKEQLKELEWRLNVAVDPKE